MKLMKTYTTEIFPYYHNHTCGNLKPVTPEYPQRVRSWQPVKSGLELTTEATS